MEIIWLPLAENALYISLQINKSISLIYEIVVKTLMC